MIVNMKKLIEQLNEIDVSENICSSGDDKFRVLFDDLQGIINVANAAKDKAEEFNLLEELEYLLDQHSGYY